MCYVETDSFFEYFMTLTLCHILIKMFFPYFHFVKYTIQFNNGFNGKVFHNSKLH